MQLWNNFNTIAKVKNNLNKNFYNIGQISKSLKLFLKFYSLFSWQIILWNRDFLDGTINKSLFKSYHKLEILYAILYNLNIIKKISK